jgi:hypothetical protein
MSNPFESNNPGVALIDVLTETEEAFVQNIAGLSYSTGDILYYNGTNLTRLPIGTNGKVLTVTTGLPSWETVSSGGGNVSKVGTPVDNQVAVWTGDGTIEGQDEATFKATVNLEIGTDVQAYDAGLTDIAGLAVTDGNIIVGNGTNWVAESGATARASLGLGTADSPTFAGLDLGEGNITNVGNIQADGIKADGSGGLALEASDGSDVLLVGSGGGVNATAYGTWNFDGATANTIASFGASKGLTSLSTTTYPSLTELSYIKGLTSAIQTQLNGKLSDSGDTGTGVYDFGGATSFEIPNGAGGTTIDATGEVTIDSTSRTFNFYDGTAEAVVNPVMSKSITIENPTASEDISMFYTDDAITITKIVFVITGSTSVTTTIRHSTDRSATGNEVVTSGTTVNSGTTGNVVTTFNDATVPADSFVWLETTALSGTPTSLNVTVFYRQDA